jgi:Domain of unknown function (DUF5659)
MNLVKTSNDGTEIFATGSIELAAFLLCCGIRWHLLEHRYFTFVNFCFANTPELQKAIAAFESGTGPYPPAKALFRALRHVRALAEASNQIDAFIQSWRDYAGN